MLNSRLREVDLSCVENSASQAETLFTREEAGEFYDFKVGTFASWDCNKTFDLQPEKKGKFVYYKKSVLDQIFKNPTGQPLLGPKKAAKMLGRQPGTLATWRSRGNNSLQYLIIRNSVRYSLPEVQRFMRESTMP